MKNIKAKIRAKKSQKAFCQFCADRKSQENGNLKKRSSKRPHGGFSGAKWFPYHHDRS